MCWRCWRPCRTGSRRPGPDWRTARTRRPHAPTRRRRPRALGIPVEGERGRGGSYRLKPGFRVPPLMFTTGEAVAVTLGLMAAQAARAGGHGALDKVSRVLPDHLQRASTRSSSCSPSRSASTPRRRTARPCSRSPTRPRRHRKVSARYTDYADNETDSDLHAVRRGRPQRPLVRPRLRRRPRRAARAESRPRQQGPTAGRGEAPPPDFDAVAFVAAPSRASRGRTRIEVLLHTDTQTAAAALPADARRAEPHQRRHTLPDARRIARLGRGPARRQRPRLHGQPPDELRASLSGSPKDSSAA